MTLAAGDLTTLANVKTWIPTAQAPSDAILQQLIRRMSSMIYSKLNRARIYSQQFTRVFDGQWTYQLVLPDYPVTSIASLQVGSALITAVPLPAPGMAPPANPGYGYRFVPWMNDLPGQPTVVEFVNGAFYPGAQNVKVIYTAGYLISNEAQTIPASPGPYTVTVTQPQGICSHDNGVVYTSTGITLTPVAAAPNAGQYIPPPDTTPGLYTFSASDQGIAVLISYSFIPDDLEEACIQMVAERFSYRGRVGLLDQTLGSQETMRYLRGGMGRGQVFDLPPEVEALIWPYVSVVPPAIGAPV